MSVRADLGEVDTGRYQRQALASGRFLRVLNCHHTPAGHEHQLRAQLRAYLGAYQPVGPEDLDRFYDTGEWSLPRPGMIFAFYDGYANNATVAARICDELGIRAWFFPPTGWLDVPAEEQPAYVVEHAIDISTQEPEPPWPMTWDQLAWISERHVIAAHTANHAAAVDIVTPEDVEREITAPIRRLTEVTGRMPASFAFLWGTPPIAGTVAGDAVLTSGVRYATANTAYVRIAD